MLGSGEESEWGWEEKDFCHWDANVAIALLSSLFSEICHFHPFKVTYSKERDVGPLCPTLYPYLRRFGSIISPNPTPAVTCCQSCLTIRLIQKKSTLKKNQNKPQEDWQSSCNGCTHLRVVPKWPATSSRACFSVVMSATTLTEECGGLRTWGPSRKRTVAWNFVWVFRTWGGCLSTRKELKGDITKVRKPVSRKDLSALLQSASWTFNWDFTTRGTRAKSLLLVIPKARQKWRGSHNCDNTPCC